MTHISGSHCHRLYLQSFSLACSMECIRHEGSSVYVLAYTWFWRHIEGKNQKGNVLPLVLLCPQCPFLSPAWLRCCDPQLHRIRGQCVTSTCLHPCSPCSSTPASSFLFHFFFFFSFKDTVVLISTAWFQSEHHIAIRRVAFPRYCKFISTTTGLASRPNSLCIGAMARLFSWSLHIALFIYNIHVFSLPAWHFSSLVDFFIAFSQSNITQELDWGMESQTFQVTLRLYLIINLARKQRKALWKCLRRRGLDQIWLFSASVY